jgi:hypothetical protein
VNAPLTGIWMKSSTAVCRTGLTTSSPLDMETNLVSTTVIIISLLMSLLLLPPTIIPLSGVGRTCFSSCCDKDSTIIFTTGRLLDVNPP